MDVFAVFALFAVTSCFSLQCAAEPAKVSGAVLTGESAESCPSQEVLNASKTAMKKAIVDILQQQQQQPGARFCPCGGPGEWTRIAYLNMSDPSQQCPSNWSLITSPVRACGRPSRDCHSAIFSSRGRSYSRVCGKLLAYQRGTMNAFNSGSSSFDDHYVDGISVTHGPAGSRQHIWTFAGALDSIQNVQSNCPCTSSATWLFDNIIPAFVGNDYFCDSSNPRSTTTDGIVYADDLMWDGTGCPVGNTCCEFNNPPWFCKTLPQPTAGDLEVRNCAGDTPGNEDTLVQFIDIYVM